MQVSEFFAGSEDVFIPEQVFPPELNRVQAQSFSDHIHLALVGPNCLRHAKATQGPSRDLIGPYGARVDLHMWDLVRT